MNFNDGQQHTGRPGLFSTILVVISVLAVYPVAGSLLTMLVIGDVTLDEGFRWLSAPLVPKMLAAQGIGQILVLALPVLWLVSRFSGDGLFGRATLGWLGIGRRGGVRPALMAGAGMLLLQPALYSIVELQLLLLPYLGSVGKKLMQDQARLDQLLRKLAGGVSNEGIILSALVLVVTPAICEELFFRGYIQKSLALNLSPRRAVLFTGIVFAMFHLEWFNFAPLALLGWYIGYIYQRSDNLLAPAVAHGMNNLAALILMKTGVDSGVPSDATSGTLLSLPWWWALVAVTMFLFSLLIRSFPERPALQDADNPMPRGHR
ncbi:MAG: CPBP family intramembrane metalloprotease [Chlorobaculum sp.]|nr:CPBP family intramembrane metalloprotease [Chlorobaculum sp.]